MRENVWFPNLDQKVREIIDRCNACQATGQQNPPEPMCITPTPDKPWHTVAIDFKGPVPNTSEYLVLVTDVYSKYPEVEVARSTEATTVIPQLDKIFVRHEIPAKITTDNGPPFSGKEFERYMALLGVTGSQVRHYGHRAMQMLKVSWNLLANYFSQQRLRTRTGDRNFRNSYDHFDQRPIARQKSFSKITFSFTILSII